MTPGMSRAAVRDDGMATVWAAAGVAMLMGALLIGLHLGAAVAARHRAEAAADLAALGAAALAVHGADTACRRAEVIADGMGGEVTRCLLSGWDALVEVRVDVPLALTGTGDAIGRARAGPVVIPLRVVVSTVRHGERSTRADGRTSRVTGRASAIVHQPSDDSAQYCCARRHSRTDGRRPLETELR